MALSFPLPSRDDEAEELAPPNLALVAPVFELQWSPLDPHLVDNPQRPTSFVALAIFLVGLVAAAALVGSAPQVGAAAIVTGIVGGGVMNAPAGAERRRTVAALGIPTVGLTALTVGFLTSL